MAIAMQHPEVGSDSHPSEHKSLAGGPGSGFVSEEARRLIEQARAVRERQKQALHLQRGYILSQHPTNPARRAALVAALAQIDGEILAIN
ncbi:MAG: hypothetical protein ACLQGT_03495 [Terracidiphilus sp.]